MTSRIRYKALLALVYAAGAFAYAVHESETGRGLGGWIVDMIFQLTGALTPKIATLLVLVVLLVPGILLIAALPTQKPLTQAPDKPWPLWPFFLAITLAGAAFPAGLHRWLAARDAEDQARAIVDIDLTRSTALPSDALFVRIAGYRPLGTRFEITRSIYTQLKTSNTTIPLVARNAAGEPPVAWFFEGTLPRSFRPPGGGDPPPEAQAPLYGEVTRNGLPRFIESAFAHAGVTLADPYYRVEEVAVDKGHVASRMGQYEMLPWFGFATGPLALMVAGLAWLLIRREPGG